MTDVAERVCATCVHARQSLNSDTCRSCTTQGEKPNWAPELEPEKRQDLRVGDLCDFEGRIVRVHGVMSHGGRALSAKISYDLDAAVGEHPALRNVYEPSKVAALVAGVVPAAVARAAEEFRAARSKSPAECVTKTDVLDKAIAAVADRGLNYGKPEDNFLRIARLWNAHLVNVGLLESNILGDIDKGITPADVALMMDLMKTARLENQPAHLDSWVDKAGYAACGAELTKAR